MQTTALVYEGVVSSKSREKGGVTLFVRGQPQETAACGASLPPDVQTKLGKTSCVL